MTRTIDDNNLNSICFWSGGPFEQAWSDLLLHEDMERQILTYENRPEVLAGAGSRVTHIPTSAGALSMGPGGS